MAVHWQNPGTSSYGRTPSGANPANPITLSVAFDDQSACPTQLFRFWTFSATNTQLDPVGTEAVPLTNGAVTQEVVFTVDVPIEKIKLACVDGNGDFYDGSIFFESGTPAFTPRSNYESANWQTPANYTRTPEGEDVNNPVTFSAEFDNFDGCPTQLFSFAIFDELGAFSYMVGVEGENLYGKFEQTEPLPPNEDIYEVKLVCVDEEGEVYDATAALELGSPAFTPEPQYESANWQTPADYERSPPGADPAGTTIMFRVEFDDHTGCTSQEYAFLVYQDSEPYYAVSENVSLQSGLLIQWAELPDNVPVEEIRFACMDGDEIVAVSAALESGSPAFTPYVPVHWQTPGNYTRTPPGSEPTNPITFSAEFDNQEGCPTQEYAFWIFNVDGTPGAKVSATPATLVNGVLVQVANLTADVGIPSVKLACLDENGDLYDATGLLEWIKPAFTPQE